MTLAPLRSGPSPAFLTTRRLLFPATLPPATRLFPPARATFLARAITLACLTLRPIASHLSAPIAAIAAPSTQRSKMTPAPF
jgi:hypothetical protein